MFHPEDRLRDLAKSLRREEVKKRKRTLPVWQVDAREELCRLIKATGGQKQDDAPPERED